jgi:hypothetical protein
MYLQQWLGWKRWTPEHTWAWVETLVLSWGHSETGLLAIVDTFADFPVAAQKWMHLEPVFVSLDLPEKIPSVSRLTRTDVSRRGPLASKEGALSFCARHPDMYSSPELAFCSLPCLSKAYLFATLHTSPTWSAVVAPQMFLFAVDTCRCDMRLWFSCSARRHWTEGISRFYSARCCCRRG